ncbi:TetR family transcriptional regulator [Streptomyces angustmyceticus]|uniref:TetR family transcriptional regulator n=1 Tax=Streptomyces angustmyceticus TaxID=285578 RepID=UPI001CBE1A79|nr:TetR family transcriptional regulator [Streptomyces angustmyceticus]
MSAKRAGEQGGRTFTEEARRAQIVRAAIDTVAEHGYPHTSFSKIAQQAGLSSTGMISYYFAGKAELFDEVVATVLRAAEEFVGPRLQREQTYRAKLRVYIESNLAFMAEYPGHTLALAEIVLGTRDRDNVPVGAVNQATASLDVLVDCLDKGLAAGEFADLEPRVMAVAIRGAIDNTLRHHMLTPDVDLEAYGRQLADIFDRATRATA